MYNVLIIGSGGREHALAWKIKKSALCQNLFIVSGNAGTAIEGTNIQADIDDADTVAQLCRSNQINIVVIGPEKPLAEGLVDKLSEAPGLENLIIVGPKAAGAQLESSKSFAKAFMQKHNIPTASYKSFSNASFDDGLGYLAQHTMPVVIKADGLANGKGVVIAQTVSEAQEVYKNILQGTAGIPKQQSVVIEDYINGKELSVFVLTNGKTYVQFPEAKDYKRALEGDKGPNTGGMGALSPVALYTDELKQKVTNQIINPTINGLQQDGIPYQGFIFFGLMIDSYNNPYLLEYNCRLGDPETEVILPRLTNDLVEIFASLPQANFGDTQINIDPQTAVGVVVTSSGYPITYDNGKVISLPDVIDANDYIFQAGTKNDDTGKSIVTNGGRVLVVVGVDQDVATAKNRAMQTISKIDFTGMSYRTDISDDYSNAGEKATESFDASEKALGSV